MPPQGCGPEVNCEEFLFLTSTFPARFTPATSRPVPAASGRSLGWEAAFATLSGRISVLEGRLEIEMLFDRAQRGQTAKGFSEPRTSASTLTWKLPFRPESGHGA